MKRKPRTGSAAAAKKRQRQAGLEKGSDGAVVGRDPRRLSPAELRALGHRGRPLPQAMRRRCIDCCGGKVDEVRRCTAVACPLWPYRMGTDPWQAEATQPERRAAAPVAAPATVSADPAKAKPERRAGKAAPVVASAPVAVEPVKPEPAPPSAARRTRRTLPAATPLLPFLDDAPA